jgi:hypothetical protein
MGCAMEPATLISIPAQRRAPGPFSARLGCWHPTSEFHRAWVYISGEAFVENRITSREMVSQKLQTRSAPLCLGLLSRRSCSQLIYDDRFRSVEKQDRCSLTTSPPILFE